MRAHRCTAALSMRCAMLIQLGDPVVVLIPVWQDAAPPAEPREEHVPVGGGRGRGHLRP